MKLPPREAVDCLWYCGKYLTTEKGNSLDFQNRKYLRDIYDCLSPEIVIMKSAQVGISGYAVNKCIWLGDTRKISIIYVLPTKSDVSDFSQTRFNPIANFSRISGRMVVDSVFIKQIGRSFIYFRGTQGETEGQMIPADMLVVDELDRCVQNVEDAYNERLSASALSWKLWLSTPTFPNYGIDLKWQKSDRREWFVLCPKCALEQVLSENHIDPETNTYRCEKCHEVLDNQNGRWIPTAKSDIAGFHPTQFAAPWIQPLAILKKKEEYKLYRDFANYVKGEAYAGGTETVTRLDILSCLAHNCSQAGSASMGIDWGDTSWYVIRRPGRIIHYGKIEGDTRTHAQQALQIADKFPHIKIAADFGYGDIKNKTLIESRPKGAVWMVVYTTTGKDVFPRFSEKDSIVNIDRTRSLQEGMIDIKEKKVEIMPNELQEEFIKHYSNLFEKKEIAKDGTIKLSIERKGDDHLAHADNYARLFERQKITSGGDMTII